MRNITFALIAFVAMIGVALAAQPVQLSGSTGQNISANLTDDVVFMAPNESFGTMTVTVIGTEELSNFVFQNNLRMSMGNFTKEMN